MTFANCGLPYFLSRDFQRRSHLLLQTPEGFFGRYRVQVRVNTEAIEIQRGKRTVIARTSGGDEAIPYDTLILAQGGTPQSPSLPGIDSEHVFTLWTIPHMDRIHRFIEEKKPTTAVIAGGGFIGLEMAEALRARGLDVTVVELAPRVMTTMDPEFGAMIASGLEAQGICVHPASGIAGITPGTVLLDNGTTVNADMVLFSVGVRPHLSLAQAAGLEIGLSGGLVVDETLRMRYAIGSMRSPEIARCT